MKVAFAQNGNKLPFRRQLKFIYPWEVSNLKLSQ